LNDLVVQFEILKSEMKKGSFGMVFSLDKFTIFMLILFKILQKIDLDSLVKSRTEQAQEPIYQLDDHGDEEKAETYPLH
jgi:hypothetical protein